VDSSSGSAGRAWQQRRATRAWRAARPRPARPPAHTGVDGNEEADKLAKAAVDGNVTEPTFVTPDEAITTFGWATRDTGDTLHGKANIVAAAVAASSMAAGLFCLLLCAERSLPAS
jgi:hypothetical protein